MANPHRLPGAARRGRAAAPALLVYAALFAVALPPLLVIALGRPSFGLAGASGVFMLIQVACALCTTRARSSPVREIAPVSAAVATAAAMLALFPDGTVILMPAFLLWIGVAASQHTLRGSTAREIGAATPSILLVGEAVLVGGAPGLIIASGSPGDERWAMLGVLWTGFNVVAGLCACLAPRASMSAWASAAVAAGIALLTLLFIPYSLVVLVPGCLLWLVVALQSGQDEDAGLVDRMSEPVRKTYR